MTDISVLNACRSLLTNPINPLYVPEIVSVYDWQQFPNGFRLDSSQRPAVIMRDQNYNEVRLTGPAIGGLREITWWLQLHCFMDGEVGADGLGFRQFVAKVKRAVEVYRLAGLADTDETEIAFTGETVRPQFWDPISGGSGYTTWHAMIALQIVENEVFFAD